MNTSPVKFALIMTASVLAGAYGLMHREQIYDLTGFHPKAMMQTAQQQQEAAAPPAALKSPPSSEQLELKTATHMVDGSSTSIRKAQDGHFWTEARVNATSIRFLVDTGASIVALTPKDARLAGLKPEKLAYTAKINTANGQILAAPVTLDIVSVGNVSVRNVRAVVIKKGLSTSLLGMSYLGELQTVKASKTQLILRR